MLKDKSYGFIYLFIRSGDKSYGFYFICTIRTMPNSLELLTPNALFKQREMAARSNVFLSEMPTRYYESESVN